ncbi:MAG: EamA family transporter, partial [Planctomycetota bacterium]
MDNQPQTSKLIASFAAIYFVWGTTYLALRVAVESIPPFLLGAGRFLVAGTVLITILTVSRVTWPTLRQWRSAFIIGAFLFVGGNGLVTWAEKDIPSSIAALVVATMPLWMSLFDWLIFGGPRPTIQTIAGMILGFAGIIILVGPAELINGSSEFKVSAMIGLLLAPVFWSLGSLYSRTVDLPKNIFMTNAAEMLCGGLTPESLILAIMPVDTVPGLRPT